MHQPPLPPEEGNSGRPDEPRGPAPPPPGLPPGDSTDLFFTNGDAEPSDDTPTVISKGPPQPAASEDVFSGTLRGRRLAHFELIEPIGVGGMAAVIRARDLQLERQVALKILPPEMAADPENVRRFQQEARAAAKLDHENIARVFFCGEDQKLHFIAFEFVEGQNLRTLLERRGRLPVSEAIHYMLQIATGLAHAAARGVIHRDIKPSNIIISPNGRAKLVDMGLARQLGPTFDQGLTQSGVTLGTFDYISPEQALEPRDADVRSDIYSLGCTFYHALTGQPPVPEGTAAKKLHHHQHVAPLDPRQLNPDIPDDLAAILARMMTKDPKDRYQRPEHLVQHLLQVAQKQGVAADGAEGVLFVDAPLPAPPRPRPLLLALAAAAGLMVLVIVLGQMSRSAAPATAPQVASVPGETSVQPTNAETTSKKVPDAAAPEAGAQNTEGARGAPPAPPAPLIYNASPREAKSLAEFVARPLQADQPERLIELDDDVDLGKENLGPGGPGLVFNGGKTGRLTIKAKGRGKRPVIRIHPEATAPSNLWAALKVQGGTVTLKGLRFEIDANQVPGITMAALYCQGGHVDVEDCEFVQSSPPDDGSSRLSAVEVAGFGGEMPTVSFQRCCFLRAPKEAEVATASLAGQNVVTLAAPGSVDLTDCAFGPHAAVLAFQGAGPEANLEGGARLTHCTGLLSGDAAVVRVENAAGFRMRTTDCLFWAPGSAAEEGAPAGTLVRQVTGSPEALGHWNGQHNRYYNLAAFWQLPEADEPVRGLESFAEKLQGVSGQEMGSEVLASPPCPTDEPLAHLDVDSPDDLRQAFQPDVRLADLRTDKKHLVGVEQLLDARPYNRELPPPQTDTVVAPGRRVVDPLVKVPGNGVYKTLAAALADAQRGDVIELRFNGPLMVSNTIRLDLPNLTDVTIRPYGDSFHPILVLSPSNPEDDEGALFRLYDGKLKLEKLQVQLQSAGDTPPLQAVVTLVGDGSCTFTDCVLTLEQPNGARLAAVAVADLPAAMRDNKMSRPAGLRATAVFKNCVVRGDGDLVADRAGRPVNVDADNALFVLGGSVLNLEAAGDELPAAFAGTSASLQLNRMTAYLSGNLVHFRAEKDVRGLVPVQVSPTGCLFLAAAGGTPGSARPLVHLDGPDTSEERMKQLLPWTGQGNAYNGFSPMLDQAAGGGEMAAMPYNRARWQELTHETDAVYDRVKLVESPGPDFVLAQAKPSQFRIRSDPDQQGYGADLAQLALLFPAGGMAGAGK